MRLLGEVAGSSQIGRGVSLSPGLNADFHFQQQRTARLPGTACKIEVMNELFSNRELASLILLGLGGLVALVLVVKSRTTSLNSFRSAFSLLVSSKILFAVLLLYVGWVLVALIPASQLGLWEPGLWKPTILWLLLSGFGLLFTLNDAIEKPGFFQQVLVRRLGFLAIVEFLVNLESFALWVEIPAQVLAVLCAVVMAAQNTKHAAAAKLADAYLVLFGLSALAWAGWHLVTNWSNADQGALVRELLLPIWLTPVALIFVYGRAVVDFHALIFRLMRRTKKEGPLAKQRLAMVMRTLLSLPSLRLFRGYGAQRLARTNGFREAWNEIEQVRLDERKRIEAEAAAERRLIENAGLAGVDESGQQLDQREFDATRKALRWLATCHMGHYRNRKKKYQRDLLLKLEHGFEKYGLSKPNGITMHVGSDGQRWYAERQTGTGHWFAIGAAGPPPDEWLFDGSEKPEGFPVESEWDQWGGGEHSTNWD